MAEHTAWDLRLAQRLIICPVGADERAGGNESGLKGDRASGKDETRFPIWSGDHGIIRTCCMYHMLGIM